MLLQNLKLNPEELPQIEARDFTKLDSDYLYFRITAWSLFCIVISGIGAMVSLFGQLTVWYWLIPIVFVWILRMVFEIIGFKYRGYCIRELDVSFRRGWLFHSMTTIPLNRVQHCEFTQGPLNRLFDLATVKVYTAGGTSSDLDIRGLHKKDAIKVRDHIMELSSRYA